MDLSDMSFGHGLTGAINDKMQVWRGSGLVTVKGHCLFGLNEE